jgi:hypothetical protein
MQELAANAAIEPDPAGNVVYVGAHLLAKIGNLVDEGNLRGKKGVAGILGDFSRFDIGEHHRCLDQVERPVYGSHNVVRALGLNADDHPVRLHEVLDRCALAQELRIGHDIELSLGSRLAYDTRYLTARSDRHGRFDGDDCVAAQRFGDFGCGGVDIAEVRVAITAPARCADRNEHRVSVAHRVGKTCVEGEPTGAHVVDDQLIKARFVDRDLTLAQLGDLVGNLVDAGHVVSELSKAGSRYKPDVT